MVELPLLGGSADECLEPSPPMKVHIHKRSGTHMGALELDDSATLEDLKQLFYDKYHYYSERQQFNLGTAKGIVLTDGNLSKQGVVDDVVLVFKDLGVQISWRLVYVLEYLGPLIFVPLFWYLPSLFYPSKAVQKLQRSQPQQVAVGLFLFHFIKREWESLFVHRFSHGTMPVQRLPINCFHYWILCGIAIGYYLCHPLYASPYSNNFFVYGFAAIFLVFELCNAKCHLIQRALRPRGTRQRGIPHGCGFGFVSCANYMWESFAWITFSLLCNILTSYIFAVVAIGQMTIWAIKRHESYRRTFDDYPKSRKAIFPFIV